MTLSFFFVNEEKREIKTMSCVRKKTEKPHTLQENQNQQHSSPHSLSFPPKQKNKKEHDTTKRTRGTPLSNYKKEFNEGHSDRKRIQNYTSTKKIKKTKS